MFTLICVAPFLVHMVACVRVLYIVLVLVIDSLHTYSTGVIRMSEVAPPIVVSQKQTSPIQASS